MAQVSLLFQRTNVVIDTITLDVSLSEQHASEVEITDHPVESGTNISDHARPKPDTLVIEGMVSNDPLPQPSSTTFTHTVPGDPGGIRGNVTFASRIDDPDLTRAGQAYQDLLDLKNAGKLITVVTALRSYANMMVRSLSVPRDPHTGQILKFSITLTEVRIASLQTVNLAPVAKPVEHKGKKAVEPTPPETSKSIAAGFSDATGGHIENGLNSAVTAAGY